MGAKLTLARDEEQLPSEPRRDHAFARKQANPLASAVDATL
jgi:hypothetical protein